MGEDGTIAIRRLALTCESSYFILFCLYDVGTTPSEKRLGAAFHQHGEITVGG